MMTQTRTYGLRVTPYPYQAEGIEYGLERKRLLLGDEPGLGKTLQAVGIVNAANSWPLLVICPSSLKINWKREIERFTDKSALILSNATATVWPYLVRLGQDQAVIVNYESLRKWFVWDTGGRKGFRLRDVTFVPEIRLFRTVVIDESHRVKDPTAQQTIFCKGICKGRERVMLLTGTPVINRPEDLVSQLSIMGRLKEFGGNSGFRAKWCTDPRKKDARPLVSLSVLSDRLYSTCMIRREKKDVLTDLPEKTRVTLYVDIGNREEYDTAATDLRAYLLEYRGCTDREVRRKMRMKALVRFMTLRQLATVGKIGQACDYIGTFLGSGQKMIVFCSLHEVVDALRVHFPRAVTVTGRDAPAAKQDAVDRFQNDPGVRLIICSIRAAGVGLTLTAASNVAFVELPWTYADCCQCEDRAHRIGQKQNVTCHYVMGEATIDSTIWGLINDKRRTAAEITGSEEDIPTDERYFDELVDSFLGDNNDIKENDNET
ncbi:MAG: DEAD/DEAH box helicase [Bacteroidales bacterium]|nr:DEAD/DEAH box helicase [Bacteroidales bacterium]